MTKRILTLLSLCGCLVCANAKKQYMTIEQKSGEKYSFEKFLEYDAINRSKSNATAARPPLKAASVGNNRFEPGASPVVIK